MSTGLSVDPARPWRLEGHVGQLMCGPLAGNVDLARTVPLFRIDSWQGTARKGFEVLMARSPLGDLAPNETYIRGTDLVTTYAKLPPYEVAPHIYWRTACDLQRSAVRIEMILSVQTDLLDSLPALNIQSTARGVRVLHRGKGGFREIGIAAQPAEFDRGQSSANLFVLRDEAGGLSYAEMVHPDDFVSARVEEAGVDSGSVAIKSVLFSERLEKGVIRRGRICGWFLPAENDLAVAAELAQRFIAEPPPLTT